MVLEARTCERWLLVVVVVALMHASSCNLLPGSLNLDDDPSHDGDGSFWSQRWYGGYVDDFLVKLRHAVVDDSLDPLQPPDIELHDIDERSGLSTWHADVRLEPRDLRAQRKDSAAFDACQRHVQQLEEDQELADGLLSYMFLGRMLRVAPSGDIFGQREELRMGIQRWLETTSPLPADTSPWSHGHSTRLKHEGSGLSTWHADVRLEPRDLRALRKDSAAFDACQRHVKQLEDYQELGDALVSLLIHLARALIYTNCGVVKAGMAPKYVMLLKLSYMFLGRMLRVAPSGDIFGQREELRMSIQRWLEMSSPIPADTSPWPHGHSTRFKHKGNRLGTRGVLLATAAGRSKQQRRSFWKR